MSDPEVDAERGQLMRALSSAEGVWLSVLEHVAPSQWSQPSGCGEWTVRDLVDHVSGGAHRYAMLLDGATAALTAATRSEDYVGHDPVAAFWRSEGALRDVAGQSDLTAIVDHRMGRRSGLVLMRMRVMELTLHAKDLCDGIAAPWEPSAELCSYVLDTMSAEIDKLRAAGLFGPERRPVSRSTADLLLAFTGRA
ncbi:maleylpyruvate isomerase family mycothiol-dependent enzyme [Tsukamurella sp. 8F]|uniref:maleylpyruvate isomerase family mycothiol-dependent enzyme n=1 Tax=unclassified Tsukamurella TaxID=2633480 RepID=UPI0023B95EED|nr:MULTISPECIES: maleylpyruvate isomerase family mycothiol-dependent enzyme [unclassified Tsukamurella]MDF0528849.1 maleylpyruvate isomerase family mycothiol-dependent enzyme [Tsukamurella sp. 8J]MDF0586684.1 maleylpyruvate isomerase family mycothiol-dependent enzyme [Tsukamurella sp. 8F]